VTEHCWDHHRSDEFLGRHAGARCRDSDIVTNTTGGRRDPGKPRLTLSGNVASPEIMWDPRFALIRRLGAGSKALSDSGPFVFRNHA